MLRLHDDGAIICTSSQLHFYILDLSNVLVYDPLPVVYQAVT